MISFDFDYPMNGFHIKAKSEFPTSGISVIFGKSGCGKSTLLRLIAGIEERNSGELKVDQKVLQDKQYWTPAWKRDIAYVSQQPALFPHLSVLNNLLYAQKRKRSAANLWDIKSLIKRFGINELLSKYPEQLSGGQSQRVAIVRALLNEPRCLLLDEPVSALDEVSRFELLSNLTELIENVKMAILYVSHDRREVAQIADYILLMDEGKITSQGEYQKVSTDLNLPFAQNRNAISVLPVIVGKESDDHLTELFYAEHSFWVGSNNLKESAKMRFQIPANEISISLDLDIRTSVLNHIQVTIVAIGDDQGGQRQLSLSTGEHIILAKITSRSIERLALKVACRCYASFKAVAVTV